MARSSKQDITDKFRFEVKVMQVDFNLLAATEALGNIFNKQINQTLGTNPFVILSRAGFNEVTLPKAELNVITYRENLDNQRFNKSPGLTKFEPIILKRGSTDSLDLYQWYQIVNNDTLLMSTAQELSHSQLSIPSQDEHFRREVLISVQGRDGESVKQWMLFNAFPISYKGGNDLNSQTEEKLIEEISLAYEFFIEFQGGLGGLARELARNVASIVSSAGLNALQKQVPFIKGL